MASLRTRRPFHGLRPALFLLLAIASTSRPLAAATIHMPADQPTLQTAVAAAATGDTILIAPGTYDGGVFVDGKSLTFASEFLVTGDTSFVARTILNGVVANVCNGAPGCAGTGVLEFGASAGGSAVIGLTLTHGENGVLSSSTVDITNCHVIANGDGVDYGAGSGGTFRTSLFADNTDDGIDLNGRLSVQIVDNVIRNNRDDGIEYRLYAYRGVLMHIDVIGNRFSGNGEDGVQLIDYTGLSDRAIRIDRNVFQANFDASGSSAAIGCTPNGDTIERLTGTAMEERLYVTNNTFLGERNGLVGGANVIALNNVFVGTQGTALLRVGGNSIASHDLFWNNGVDFDSSMVDIPRTLRVDPMLDTNGQLTSGSPAIDTGAAFFQWLGETVLDLPTSAYLGSAPDLGAFEFDGTPGPPANKAPTVSAGTEQAITLPAQAALDGTVSDDGLPSPPALTTVWSVIGGPGPVTFDDTSAVDTRATFTVAGTYTLRLLASDGELTSVDFVRVVVAPAATLDVAPTVDAGVDQTVTLPAQATLDGTVTDDGLPAPPALTTTWSVASGPGPVTFADPSAVDTRATFTEPGAYTLRLTASDGELVTSDVVRIVVSAITGTIERRVAAASDDAEETAGGPISKNTSDLELVDDGNLQKVGVRFTDVAIPAGSRVTSAYVQFEADEAQSVLTNLVIQGQAADDAGAFTTTDGNVSTRPRTAATASWSPPPWTLVGEAGAAQRTADLSAVIQEIVNRPGWASGKALALIFTGTGHRTARAFEGRAAGAALLHVAYGPDGSLAPVVDAGVDQTIVLPAVAQLDGTVSDDGLPSPPTLTATWSVASGPGPVTFADANVVDTQASFTDPGTYVLRLTASDGESSASDVVRITVNAVAGAIERRVSAASDDAEEDAWGGISGNISDLELVDGGSLQKVGVRFTDVAIPAGSRVASAYIQFEADETQSEPTALVIQGQAADDAGTFTTARANVSTRLRTIAAASWSPPPWTLIGEAGEAERTVDLAAVIQEIVDRPGWASGNAMALIITGTGHRTARSFEGRAAGAPLLHVAFGPVANRAPLVDAGADQEIILPAMAQLTGAVNDDGLPSPTTLVTTWSVASGPGPVTFADGAATSTLATFTTPGTYVLRLTASDGELSAADSLQVLVHATSGVVDRLVVSGSDDAEEAATGAVNLKSTDLDLTFNLDEQKVGVRFPDVKIPPAATITQAYVQFVVDEIQSEATNLTIQGQAADNPGTFTVAQGDVSTRPRTVAAASWSPPPWTVLGEAGDGQRTPDLSAVIQEIVNRPGWASGNAIALIFTGTGHRSAVSFEDDPATVARLHVEYGQSVPITRKQVEAAADALRPAFALHGLSPSPARGGVLNVMFSLPDARTATLELLDVTGRRLAMRDVGSLGAGRHRIDLRGGLPAGVYIVRLRHGGEARTIKAVVLK